MARTQIQDLEELVVLTEEEAQETQGGDADLFTNTGSLGGIDFNG